MAKEFIIVFEEDYTKETVLEVLTTNKNWFENEAIEVYPNEIGVPEIGYTPEKTLRDEIALTVLTHIMGLYSNLGNNRLIKYAYELADEMLKIKKEYETNESRV